MNSHAPKYTHSKREGRKNREWSNDKFIVWTYEIYFLIKAIVSYDGAPLNMYARSYIYCTIIGLGVFVAVVCALVDEWHTGWNEKLKTIIYQNSTQEEEAKKAGGMRKRDGELHRKRSLLHNIILSAQTLRFKRFLMRTHTHFQHAH